MIFLKYKRKKDKKTFTFICLIDQDTFEKISNATTVKET